jgi:biopolymer transport protein ExbD
MVEKRRFLDVWIVESNTVYREVPFNVVVDWIQQGRLLEDDMLRWSGQADWFRLGGTPAFAAYIPRSEPFRVEDQAEALEPVEIGFTWQRHPDEDESDVDMIPLIDVSLVLLIFFMMTTTAVMAAAMQINTPVAEKSFDRAAPDLVWIGMDFKRDEKGNPDKQRVIMAVGEGTQKDWPADDDPLWKEGVPATDADVQALINRAVARVEQKPGPFEVNIKADTDMPSGYVRDLTKALERKSIRIKIRQKWTGVSEKR